MNIITLLGNFISYKKDNNICFNSIELFGLITGFLIFGFSFPLSFLVKATIELVFK